jgi:uncharacterized protein YbjT (DUF2867 family)
MAGRVLVTGADGTVGHELVPMLVAAGVTVRAGVRSEDDSLPVTENDAERAVIDFRAPDTLREACRDVEVVYLLTPQVPQSVAYVEAAVAAAREAGVRRVVRQSVCNVETGRDAVVRWHRRAEELVRESGLAYTFLRPNSFMQNFVSIYRDAILREGVFRLPLGDAALSSVDVRDLAAAAAAALMDDGFDSTAYTLTGPEALTGRKMATVLSAVTGRPIEYRDEPEDAGRAPRDVDERAESAALRELGLELRAGKLAAVTGDVEHLTGRRAITFEQFASDYAWAFTGAAGFGHHAA